MKENNQAKPATTSALHKATSFFFMPMRLSGKWKQVLSKSQTWQKTEMKVEQGMFYSHVLHFVEGTDAGSDAYNLQLYSPAGKENKLMLTCQYGLQTVAGKEQKDILLSPSFSPNTFASPKLIVCGGTETAILILPLHFEKDQLSVDELIATNYSLHKKISEKKLSYSNHKDYGDYLNALKKLKELDEEKREKWEEIVRHKKEALAANINILRQYTHEEPLSVDEAAAGIYTARLTTDDMTTFLMRDLEGCYIRLNEWRYHVLTYIHVNTMSDCSKEDLIRLIHCEDKNYHVSDTETLLTPFNDIMFGASAEGGVCCIECDDRSNDYFEGYDTGVLYTRYLWLYILSLMQRSALTVIEADLTLTDNAKWQSKQLKAVRELSEKVARTRVNIGFNIVSDISQHNAFLKYLDTQFDLSTRWQSIEKKSDSLEKWLVRHTERRADNFRTLFSWIISLWSVTSVLNGGLSFMQRFFQPNTSVYELLAWLVVVICAIVALALLIRFLFIKWVDRK